MLLEQSAVGVCGVVERHGHPQQPRQAEKTGKLVPPPGTPEYSVDAFARQ